MLFSYFERRPRLAGRIRGITIEISGGTTGLLKAISGVNQAIDNNQAQLKDAN